MGKNKSEKKDWTITTQRFVGFIDIMGFKDLVLRSTHGMIYKMMKVITNERERMENIDWSDINENMVKTTTFSDSIIIYSKDDSEKSFDAISNTISGLISSLFAEGVPHKGAIAFGTMTLDTKRSIYFGQPLIDAFLLQEEINFYGFLIHGSAEKKMSSFDTAHLFIQKYLCPLKNGAAHHLTIYPMDLMVIENDSIYKLDQEKVFNSLNKFRYSTSGNLRKYIDNTESYFNFIIDQIT